MANFHLPPNTHAYRLYLVKDLKQKTAYEMRESDWSSDVCSSDLKFTSIPFL